MASQTTPALRAIEDIPSFSQPNIHESGRFGAGGVLGTIGNAANSPGGTVPRQKCPCRGHAKNDTFCQNAI